MTFRNMLLLFAMACVFGPRVGTARIQSSSDAPWKPGRVLAYWIEETVTEEDDDDYGYYDGYTLRYGHGLMFLVDAEDLDCDALLGMQWQEHANILGEGLLLEVGYYQFAYNGDNIDDDLGFEGLYMGEAYALDADAYRDMSIAAIKDGFASEVTFYGFGLDSSWLRIDTHNGEAVEGEFYTPAWEGRFNALNCGEYEQEYWDTGYYR